MNELLANWEANQTLKIAELLIVFCFGQVFGFICAAILIKKQHSGKKKNTKDDNLNN